MMHTARNIVQNFDNMYIHQYTNAKLIKTYTFVYLHILKIVTLLRASDQSGLILQRQFRSGDLSLLTILPFASLIFFL